MKTLKKFLTVSSLVIGLFACNSGNSNKNISRKQLSNVFELGNFDVSLLLCGYLL